MNYQEITSAALAYADRKDVGTVNNIDMFLKVVESRIRMVLSTQAMAENIDITLINEVTEYQLPADYKAMIDLRFIIPTDNISLTLLTPEEIDATFNWETVYGYTTIGSKILLGFTPVVDNDNSPVLRMSYFKKLPELTSIASTTWLSESNPECYIFGLCVEIFSFVKDADATMLWEQRFTDSLLQITTTDDTNRWSASSITTRVA